MVMWIHSWNAGDSVLPWLISAAVLVTGILGVLARRPMRRVATWLWILALGAGLRVTGVRGGARLCLLGGFPRGRSARAFPYGIAIFIGALMVSAGAVLWAS